MSLERLVAIMRRLRDPVTGCEWDRAQDFASIAPYTIEEAYEVADAIHRGDMDDLKDELGDLQLQVVYHARMAEEIGAFDLADVLAAISAKMIRRHPHIFGDESASPGWEALKAAERHDDDDQSALAGIALALPALKRAEKLQRRAARIGFDWPDVSGPRAKIDEELEEIESAATADADAGSGVGSDDECGSGRAENPASAVTTSAADSSERDEDAPGVDGVRKARSSCASAPEGWVAEGETSPSWADAPGVDEVRRARSSCASASLAGSTSP